MGKWLDKAKLIQEQKVDDTTFVSFDSEVTGTYEAKNIENQTANSNVGTYDYDRSLYHASDLMPELNLILGAKNDEGFINDILASKTSAERHCLLSGYREVWLTAVSVHNPPSHQEDNIGRNHANRWLYNQINDQHPNSTKNTKFTNDFDKTWM